MQKTWEKRAKQFATCKAKQVRTWLRSIEERILGPRQPEWRSW